MVLYLLYYILSLHSNPILICLSFAFSLASVSIYYTDPFYWGSLSDMLMSPPSTLPSQTLHSHPHSFSSHVPTISVDNASAIQPLDSPLPPLFHPYLTSNGHLHYFLHSTLPHHKHPSCYHTHFYHHVTILIFTTCISSLPLSH